MTVYTNPILNPSAEHATLSLEQDAACTVARTNVAEGTMPTIGSYFYTLTATATSECRARTLLTQRGAAAAGQKWWTRVKLRAKASNAASRNVSVGVRFYDAVPGATAGTTLATTWGATTALAPGAAVELYVPATAPASTASAGALIRREATGVIGDVIQVDEVTLVHFEGDVPPPTIVGGRGGAFDFSGTADQSSSRYYVPTIVLLPFDDEDRPRMQITMTDLYPATRSVTVYKIVEGQTFSVREAIDLFAVGGFTATDYDRPVGTTVSYRAMQYDVNGAELGYTATASVELVADSDDTFISDPLRPANAMRVEFTDAAGQMPKNPIPGDIHRVYEGDRIRFVALVGDPSAIVGLNMDFFTANDAAREQMKTILAESNGLLLIRTPPVGSFKMLPRLLYVFAANTVPDDFNLSAGVEDVEWTNTVDEVSDPEVGYGELLVTWQTYIDAFPLWSDFNAAYLTWLDAIQNPPE